MKNLTLTISEDEEIERFICILCLGLIEAIRNGTLSINEATNYFVSPYSAQILKEKGVDDKLLMLIYLLCELENVERIIPSKLSASIDDAKNKIIEFLASISKPKLPKEYWIEDK